MTPYSIGVKFVSIYYYNCVFFRHWITIGFESDHDPELSAVISLGGRISANRDVTIKTKTNFGNILV